MVCVSVLVRHACYLKSHHLKLSEQACLHHIIKFVRAGAALGSTNKSLKSMARDTLSQGFFHILALGSLSKGPLCDHLAVSGARCAPASCVFPDADPAQILRHG